MKQTPRINQITACIRATLIAATLGFGSTASANPEGAQVVSGQVNFSQPGNGVLNIHNSPGAIINWQSFSIDKNELTRFIQQNDASAVLNRVIGGKPSEILGRLSSNGQVFLINPNGMVFGAGSVIDTAGFLASTLNMADDDFRNGRLNFEAGGARGRILNEGLITVSSGGDIILLASTVENRGVITVEGGNILLAAGERIRLGSLDMESIEFEVEAPGNEVLNLGELLANGGAAGLFAGTLTNTGRIQADTVTTGEDGELWLEATDFTHVGGTLSGSDITIAGDMIDIKGARISADGENGGGRIRIGGDKRGEPIAPHLPNASKVSVDNASRISADALYQGDGGEVILWSEQQTRVDGDLSASANRGHGGFVETSSRGELLFSTAVDVSSELGDAGTWLLDPEDIVIGDGEASAISDALNDGSNVSIETAESGDGEGNITIAAAISKTEGDDASLSMRAHNRIDVNAPITSSEGKLDVSLAAGGEVNVNASVETNGGGFSTRVDASLAYQPPEPEVEEVEEEAEEEQPIPVETEESAEDETPSGAESEQDPGATGTPDEESGSEQTEIAELPETEAVETELVEMVTTPADIHGQVPETGITVTHTISTTGGDIEIDAGLDKAVEIAGTVDASNTEAGQTGGDIVITGAEITIEEDAVVDASGDAGGGDITIGGGFNGNDPDIDNASHTTIEAGATVRSDAITNGDGGTVIVYGEESLTVDGQLSVRGGSEGGDGGFIETSSKGEVVVTQSPDISAPNGKGGTWLIDPTDYDIDVANWAVIKGALSGGNNSVIVQTTNPNALPLGNDGVGDGNITISTDLDYDGIGNNGSTLKLFADNDIYVNKNIEDGNTSSSDLLNLELRADCTWDGSNCTGNNSGSVIIDADAGGDALGVNIDLAEGNLTVSGVNFELLGGDGLDEFVDLDIGELDVDITGDFRMIAGSGDNARVQILSSGKQSVMAGGDVTLSGGSGASTWVELEIDGTANGNGVDLSQSISANNISLTGGSGAKSRVYVDNQAHVLFGNNANISQNISALGNVSLTGGSQAVIGSSNAAAVQIRSNVTHDGGNNVLANQSVSATNILLQGGTGQTSGAFIRNYADVDSGNGNNLSQEIAVTGNLRLISGNQSNTDAWITQAASMSTAGDSTDLSQNVTANDLFLVGGSGAAASSNIYQGSSISQRSPGATDQLDMSQAVVVAQDILMTGGAGINGSHAHIENKSDVQVSGNNVDQSQLVSAQNITMTAGSGNGADAEIEQDTTITAGNDHIATQTVIATNLIMQAGSGDDSDALIISDARGNGDNTNVSQSVNIVGNISMNGGSGDSADAWIEHVGNLGTGNNMSANQSVIAGNIELNAGSGNNAGSTIKTWVWINGGSNINADQTVQATAGNVSLSGGSFSASEDAGVAWITQEARVLGASANASLSQTVSAQNVLLDGGTGSSQGFYEFGSNFDRINAGILQLARVSPNGDGADTSQSVTATDELRLQGGDGFGAEAIIGNYANVSGNNVNANQRIQAANIAVLGGGNESASSIVIQGAIVTGNHSDASQHVSALVGNVSVMGGTDEWAEAGIIAWQNGMNGNYVDARQNISGSNVKVVAGSASNSDALVMQLADLNYASPVTVGNASQNITATNNILLVENGAGSASDALIQVQSDVDYAQGLSANDSDLVDFSQNLTATNITVQGGRIGTFMNVGQGANVDASQNIFATGNISLLGGAGQNDGASIFASPDSGSYSNLDISQNITGENIRLIGGTGRNAWVQIYQETNAYDSDNVNASQNITATGNISLTAGSYNNTEDAGVASITNYSWSDSTNSDYSQNLIGNNVVLNGGAGEGEAFNGSITDAATFVNNDVEILSGANNSAAQNITGTNSVRLLGGTGTQTAAIIGTESNITGNNSDASQTITGGFIEIAAGSGQSSDAGFYNQVEMTGDNISSIQSVQATAGNVSITGGSYIGGTTTGTALIVHEGQVTGTGNNADFSQLVTGNNIILNGGSGNSLNYLASQRNHQTIEAGIVQLSMATGGVDNMNASQRVDAVNAVHLMGGSGLEAEAVIANFANVSGNNLTATQTVEGASVALNAGSGYSAQVRVDQYVAVAGNHSNVSQSINAQSGDVVLTGGSDFRSDAWVRSESEIDGNYVTATQKVQGNNINLTTGSGDQSYAWIANRTELVSALPVTVGNVSQTITASGDINLVASNGWIADANIEHAPYLTSGQGLSAAPEDRIDLSQTVNFVNLTLMGGSAQNAEANVQNAVWVTDAMYVDSSQNIVGTGNISITAGSAFESNAYIDNSTYVDGLVSDIDFSQNVNVQNVFIDGGTGNNSIASIAHWSATDALGERLDFSQNITASGDIELTGGSWDDTADASYASIEQWFYGNVSNSNLDQYIVANNLRLNGGSGDGPAFDNNASNAAAYVVQYSSSVGGSNNSAMQTLNVANDLELSAGNGLQADAVVVQGAALLGNNANVAQVINAGNVSISGGSGFFPNSAGAGGIVQQATVDAGNDANLSQTINANHVTVFGGTGQGSENPEVPKGLILNEAQLLNSGSSPMLNADLSQTLNLTGDLLVKAGTGPFTESAAAIEQRAEAISPEMMGADLSQNISAQGIVISSNDSFDANTNYAEIRQAARFSGNHATANQVLTGESLTIVAGGRVRADLINVAEGLSGAAGANVSQRVDVTGAIELYSGSLGTGDVSIANTPTVRGNGADFSQTLIADSLLLFDEDGNSGHVEIRNVAQVLEGGAGLDGSQLVDVGTLTIDQQSGNQKIEILQDHNLWLDIPGKTSPLDIDASQTVRVANNATLNGGSIASESGLWDNYSPTVNVDAYQLVEVGGDLRLLSEHAGSSIRHYPSIQSNNAFESLTMQNINAYQQVNVGGSLILEGNANITGGANLGAYEDIDNIDVSQTVEVGPVDNPQSAGPGAGNIVITGGASTAQIYAGTYGYILGNISNLNASQNISATGDLLVGNGSGRSQIWQSTYVESAGANNSSFNVNLSQNLDIGGAISLITGNTSGDDAQIATFSRLDSEAMAQNIDLSQNLSAESLLVSSSGVGTDSDAFVDAETVVEAYTFIGNVNASQNLNITGSLDLLAGGANNTAYVRNAAELLSYGDLITDGNIEQTISAGNTALTGGSGLSARAYIYNSAYMEDVTFVGEYGGQDIQVSSLSLQGGSSSNTAAEIYAGGNQSVAVSANPLTLAGGSGTNSAAYIWGDSRQDVIAPSIVITGGSGSQAYATITKETFGGGQMVTTTNGGLSLLSGSGPSARATIENNADGSQVIDVAGDIILDASAAVGNFAGAGISHSDELSTQTVTADGNIRLTGGAGTLSGAAIRSDGAQYVEADADNDNDGGLIALQGGSGLNTQADIVVYGDGLQIGQDNSQTVIADAIELVSGTGTSSQARIFYDAFNGADDIDGRQTVQTGSLTVTANESLAGIIYEGGGISNNLDLRQNIEVGGAVVLNAGTTEEGKALIKYDPNVGAGNVSRSQSVTANSLVATGGSAGNKNSAGVLAFGNQSVVIGAGGIALNAGNNSVSTGLDNGFGADGNGAFIHQRDNDSVQNIVSGGDLVMNAGSGLHRNIASIVNVGNDQTVTVTGDLTLTGGQNAAASNNRVAIRSDGASTIEVGGMTTLQGGLGANDSARLQAGTTMTLTSGSDINLIGGSGSNAYAQVIGAANGGGSTVYMDAGWEGNPANINITPNTGGAGITDNDGTGTVYLGYTGCSPSSTCALTGSGGAVSASTLYTTLYNVPSSGPVTTTAPPPESSPGASPGQSGPSAPVSVAPLPGVPGAPGSPQSLPDAGAQFSSDIMSDLVALQTDNFAGESLLQFEADEEEGGEQGGGASAGGQGVQSTGIPGIRARRTGVIGMCY